MKLLEPGLFAAALLAVPMLAWSIGRAMGWRDWSISRVVAAGFIAALVPNLIRVALLASARTELYQEALWREAARTLDYPEVGLFFVTLSVFMTMLGWTATPVGIVRPDVANPRP